MNLEQFPILASTVLKTERFEASLQAINDGIQASSIRNVVLKEAKETLSRAVNDAYKTYISEVFFYGGKWENLSKEVVELYDSVNVHGLHDVIAASKRVNKSTLQDPAVVAMRTFLNEALPLAEAVASLKDKIVKGRVLNEPKPVNPNKIIKTCPCCFRKIAVVGATMAHHGYERPQIGWQTPSCYGVRFKPLEVSNEGLVWLIGVVKSRFDKVTELLSKKDSLTELTIQVRIARNKYDTQVVKKGETRWFREFDIYSSRLKYEFDGLKKELASLQDVLANWKQVDFN